MNLPQNLLLLGKVRPERKRSLTGMAAAAKLPLIAIEDPGEALRWLEDNDVVCLVVDAGVARLDKIITKLRSKAQHSHVPVFALTQSPDDLWIEQYFNWGGDDIVAVDAGASLLERLKSVPREAPKPSPWRGVVVADPDQARCDVIARAFTQAGSTVTTVTERSRLEQVITEQAPTAVVANAAIGEISEAIMRLRRNRIRSGWVVLSARRDIEVQQAALAPLERCVVMGLQSSPWQVLYRANEVSRMAAGGERRTDVRYYVGTTVLFRAAGADEDEQGVCYNLSSSGMFIRTFAPLVANQVWIEWRIPGEKTRVRLEGEVIWRQSSMSDPERTSSPLGFGVRFGDYLGAAKTHLERVLDALGNASKKHVSVPPGDVLSSSAMRPTKPVGETTPIGNKNEKLRPAAVKRSVASTTREPQTVSEKEPDGPKRAVPNISSGKAVRPLSIPPRPAGSVVNSPERPEPKAASARSPGLFGSDSIQSAIEPQLSDAIEPQLDDAMAPQLSDAIEPQLDDAMESSGSERTEIRKNPLSAFERDESLSESLLTAAPLSESHLDDDPTVITQAAVPDLLASLASEGASTVPLVKQPSAEPIQLSTQWDDDELSFAPKHRKGLKVTALTLVALVAVGLGAWFLLREELVMNTKQDKLLATLPPSVGAIRSGVAPTSSGHVSVRESNDAGTGENLQATVTADPGGDLPGYPPVDEPQAGKGRLLAERYGYLIVRFPEPAFIFSDAIAIGPVNSKIATTCGTKKLRIGVGEKPATYLSDLGEVKVACQGTTRVVFKRLPSVEVPPGALRPYPIGSGAGAVKANKNGNSSGEVEVSKGSNRAPGNANIADQVREKAIPADEGVVDSRE